MFDNCQIGTNLTTCEQDLLSMHQAGLQVAVVGFQGDSLSDLSAYAAYAQSIGMSIMWQINDPRLLGRSMDRLLGRRRLARIQQRLRLHRHDPGS